MCSIIILACNNEKVCWLNGIIQREDTSDGKETCAIKFSAYYSTGSSLLAIKKIGLRWHISQREWGDERKTLRIRRNRSEATKKKSLIQFFMSVSISNIGDDGNVCDCLRNFEDIYRLPKSFANPGLLKSQPKGFHAFTNQKFISKRKKLASTMPVSEDIWRFAFLLLAVKSKF